MKKLLTILGSLGMAATGSTALVSCGTTTKAADSIGNQIRELEYQKEELVEQIRIANEELNDLNKSYSSSLSGLQKQEVEIKTQIYLLEHVDPSRATLVAEGLLLGTKERLLEDICKLEDKKNSVMNQIKIIEFKMNELQEEKNTLDKESDELDKKLAEMNKTLSDSGINDDTRPLLDEMIAIQNKHLELQASIQKIEKKSLSMNMLKANLYLEIPTINRNILDLCNVDRVRVINNPNNCFNELKEVKQAIKEKQKLIEEIDYFKEHKMNDE